MDSTARLGAYDGCTLLWLSVFVDAIRNFVVVSSAHPRFDESLSLVSVCPCRYEAWGRGGFMMKEIRPTVAERLHLVTILNILVMVVLVYSVWPYDADVTGAAPSVDNGTP